MNTKTLSALTTFFGIALLGVTSSSGATDVQSAPERVMAYGNYYTLKRAAIDDLDTLEAAVRAMSPKGIQLNACGENAAQALKAATHRFRDLPVHLHVFDASAPICEVAVAHRASQRTALVPAGIDESAVERYWVQVTP